MDLGHDLEEEDLADVGAFAAHIGAADDVEIEFRTHFLYMQMRKG